MFQINGEDFGQIIFGANSTRSIAFSRQSTMFFFKRMALLKSNLIANSLGLYSYAQAEADGTVKFAHLRGPQHVLRPRTTGCTWDPVKGITLSSQSFTSAPLEFQAEQCPDVFIGTCFEEFFGRTEKEKESFFSTEQGRALFNEMLELIFVAIGNSYYDVNTWGQNGLITYANDNATYTAKPDVWLNYTKQQGIIAGHMTLLDKLKQEGFDNMNVAVEDYEISDDGKSFIGNAQLFMDRLIAAQNDEMLTMAENGNKVGIIELDPRIWDKYEAELMLKYDQLPAMLQYFYNGKFCESLGCDSGSAVQGVLRYKGYPVIRRRDWSRFNTLTGTNTFRGTLTAPGNYGISYDVLPQDQFGGFGLELEQSTAMKDRGLVYMTTRFRTGTGIIEPTFTVNASRTIITA
jgi:hypothetical protein